MPLTTFLAEFFLLSLAFGVGSFSFLADTRQTGVGFIKLMACVCGVSLLLSTILSLTYGHWGDGRKILYGIGLLAYWGIFFFHQEEKKISMWVLFGVHTLALFFALLFFPLFGGKLGPLLFALSSALLIGVISYAMLMGHWYLVTPKLSAAPLKKCHYFLWSILIGKILFIFFQDQTLFSTGHFFHKILFLMRVSWGYGAVGVMSFFSYRLVALRSLQSATGFFYTMTFLVFGGELIALYLFFRHGIYL